MEMTKNALKESAAADIQVWGVPGHPVIKIFSLCKVMINMYCLQ
jgi:hypothetical protein